MTAYVPPIRRHDTAKGHYYKDGAGQRVKGVTTWGNEGVPKPKLIDWAGNSTARYAVDHWDELSMLPPVQRYERLQRARYEERDTAKDRGTEVHRAAERLLAGQAVQVPEEIAPHVESYARFLDDLKVEPVYVEFSCVSYKWGYAGTADLCAWLQLPERGRTLLLLDLKTGRSGIFGETALQLAAYRYADKWVIDGKEFAPEQVDHCAGIHVRADGYDLRPIEAGIPEHKDFLRAMGVAMFVDRSRDLIGPPIMPASTSTFRLVRDLS